MATLVRPSEDDPSRSIMENNLDLRSLAIIRPDLFTNAKPLWHPPGARGLYGGAIIAQCLAAAQKTVPADFAVHSMHCYFVLNGSAEIPVIYHVERVREGRSFATRTVQARQRGNAIFTVTLSFQKVGSAGKKKAEHQVPLPEVPPPFEDESEILYMNHGPFESQTWEAFPEYDAHHEMKVRMWIKAKGRISDQGGPQAHCTALAYISDSFFIGTVARAHRLWRSMPPRKKDADEHAKAMEKRRKMLNGSKENNEDSRPELGMMVSLDHTIYFHAPLDFRADEWMLSEMETPWAGDGRGLVMQRIWTKDGKLIATCVQEGLVRLKQDTESKL